MLGWLLALGLVLTVSEGAAQPPAALPRVGILTFGVPEQPLNPNSAAIVRGLREAGYVERRNVLLDWRFTGHDPARFAQLATDLAREKVDAIVARGPDALRAAWQATRTIPIVAIDLESDPVESGVAASVARPGGNVTGIFLDQPELGGKLVEVLREAFPGLHRVGVLWNPAAAGLQFRATEAAARAMGVEIQSLEVRTPQDLERAFDAAAKGRAQAAILLSSPLIANQRVRVAELAVRNRLPSIAVILEVGEAGGLLAYGPTRTELYVRLGAIIAKILRGARPADLPIERPARFDLVVNLRTARTLGVTVPPPLLLRATRIIE